MTAVVLLAGAVLAAVAAAGVLRPFRAGVAGAPERFPDPLEEERDALLRSLRDLDEDRRAGSLTEAGYRALRAEAEARAVAVLRALEARDGDGHAAATMRELRAPAAAEAEPRGGRGRSGAAGILILAAVIAGAAPLLWSAVSQRSPGQPVTGTVGGNPLAAFEERVREHPNDLAARLDLGERYLAAGNVRGAVEQYVAALQIDPRNAEAHAQLGFVLFRAGRPADGLRAVDRALELEPRFPLALFYRGVILLQGLDRPGPAAEAFRAYLDVAPFGSFREDARRLLERAERRA
ncbi:MAG TPA: tetratricopeptide repeat protein [Actinomycetota bacterium]|nr:tetratricopeptide repeat protein [Actinomycetota bacterium]